jgi:GntR family transcriptional repressor for pyruvate dehydrogenase complex
MDHKIRPQTVAEAVIERILAEISAGQLQPDQRLPPQREIARRLGVSNSSVREALQSLQTMGVIEIRHGVGAFVLDPSYIRPMLKPEPGPAALTPRRIEEVMEARCVIEIAVIRLAACHATEEDMQKLSDYLAEMTRALSQNDGRRYSEFDMRFHLQLAESAGNVFLLHFVHTLAASVRALFDVLPYSSAGLLRHRHILDAVRRRDPVAAAHNAARLMRHSISLLGQHGQLTHSACQALDALLQDAESSRGAADFFASYRPLPPGESMD